MKITIVGGGIGGMATALSLHARGVECSVYEQSTSIRELGVGINLLPHGVKVLDELGLMDRLDAIAIRTRELIMMDRHGNEVWRERRGLDAGHDVPQFSIHRGRLQGVLYEAVCDRLGEDAVHVDRQLFGFEQDDTCVKAAFAGRRGEIHNVRADALIAADGLHSVVRAAMYPEEGSPRWNGVMMWRGAMDWPAFLDGRTMIVAGGTHCKLVLYPIAPGSTPRHRLTNWAICAKVAEAGTAPPRRELWSRVGLRSELQPHLDRLRIAGLDLNALVDATSEFYEYPMCDREPLPAWSSGRVTLLGDAAHPMFPMGSNGASQAILDAHAVAQAIASESNVPAALRYYQDSRMPATTATVRLNRRGGPESIIDIVEERAPQGFEHIDDVITQREIRAVLNSYAAAAGFAKEPDKAVKWPLS